MADKNADIVIHGGGIAGLWLLARLSSAGYDVLLLEKEAIGGTQTMAAQGIIHAGLKYTLAGKVSQVAREISAMPELWRAALAGNGPVDLSAARLSANSQQLCIPKGFTGGLVKLVTQKALGGDAHEIESTDWPEGLTSAGFTGSLIHMAEPVVDVPSVVRALGDKHQARIRKPSDTKIPAQIHIFTAAGSNHAYAVQNGHDQGLKTQTRPLLMGMLKPAPYPLFVHLVGTSEKPVATITTHTSQDGTLVWYIGGGVAERAKEDNPAALYDDIAKAFAKYLPQIDLGALEFAALPIDRIEGKSNTPSYSRGHMPDTPTIHAAGNALYCWPTKMTFAPLLAERVLEHLTQNNIHPSGTCSDWSHLPPVDFAVAPWDKALWTKMDGQKTHGSGRSAKQA